MNFKIARNKYVHLLACIVLLCFVFSASNCKSKAISTTDTKTEKNHQFLFLDSTQSAQAIISDTMESFFENIRIVDMEIQMKRRLPDEKNLAIDLYKKDLQKNVRSFTTKEKQWVEAAVQKAINLASQINKNTIPQAIRLVKITGKHYGEGTYYTREGCIMIPEDKLMSDDNEGFMETMLHEIFHIYSRYYPEKRKELYELVGFKKLNSNLSINPLFDDLILTNPDGIDFQYYIELDEDGRKFKAIPIIYSTSALKPKQADFFSYLGFELFELVSAKNGYVLKISKDRRSTLPSLNKIKSFWKQTRKNTQYIIHPDEVLADNFIIIAKATEKASIVLKYSKEGQDLIKKMKGIIEE